MELQVKIKTLHFSVTTTSAFVFEGRYTLQSFCSSGWARTREAPAWGNTGCHERRREGQSGQDGPWLGDKVDWESEVYLLHCNVRFYWHSVCMLYC